MTAPFTESEAESVIRALRERRTTGPLRFNPERKPRHQDVLEAIESARWAPNHKRTEPWRFYLLGTNEIAALAEVNAERMRLAGSPETSIAGKLQEWSSSPGVMIMLCEHAADHDAILRQENYAACAAAAQNFQLHLHARGIASKWSTAACWNLPGFWELLGLQDWPERTLPVGIFFYGVPLSRPPAMRNLEAAQVTTDLTSQD